MSVCMLLCSPDMYAVIFLDDECSNMYVVMFPRMSVLIYMLLCFLG